METNNEIKVSVICLAYNHEKYIRKCLDGFVMQKTNFKYEVLINDDCSTDNTAKIIKEYEEKYPDIIKPVYQKVNQYSQGIDICDTFLLPKSKAKYIAFCEGDDAWCDENKLQLQYDYMKNHDDCMLCATSYKTVNSCNGKIKAVHRSKKDVDFTLNEVARGGGFFATCSLMMNIDVVRTMPKCFDNPYYGDYQMVLYGAILGKIHYISKITSVYNIMTEGSWSRKLTKDKKIRVNEATMDMLNDINSYYNLEYDAIFQREIKKLYLENLYTKDEFKEIYNDEFFKKNKNLYSKSELIKIYLGSHNKKLLNFILKVKDKLKR